MSCSGSREIGPQSTWYTADEVSVPPNLKTKIEHSFPPKNPSFIPHIPRHPTNLWVKWLSRLTAQLLSHLHTHYRKNLSKASLSWVKR